MRPHTPAATGLLADVFCRGRVRDGCTMPWSNGMVEGFVNKVKWMKRSSYGQAGFSLLQRRVLLHPSHPAQKKAG
jgi:hypothetical protein